MLEIVQLTDINHPDFQGALQIYLDSFPACERQPLEILETRLSNQLYQWFVAKADNKVVGIALLYPLKPTDFILLDYLGTDKKYRSRGIGRMLMSHLINLVKSQEHNLLIEVENPQFCEDSEQAERRIKFYQNNGAKVLESVRYLLPPLSGDVPTEMLLMMVPAELGGQLPGSLVQQLIEQVYQEMYDRPSDDALLRSFIEEVPDVVQFVHLS
ncbi:GNAT family N-acetyltransferase [Laspinema olomoucense]|uniref:GNAT family N-acetyltransferase n=1 Tax=Laspinema olomoucense TaxID=3231600 RepID=UPI0021BB26FE|nr:GNAT family N-acetyltransferase [Laspinema sp. D3c]MCT7994243.1 GNAT family N-acetyltransferase [Laspinema sp. D3c]